MDISGKWNNKFLNSTNICGKPAVCPAVVRHWGHSSEQCSKLLPSSSLNSGGRGRYHKIKYRMPCKI